jgi:pimeloyl-ACP methyl ester carboxylesterase
MRKAGRMLTAAAVAACFVSGATAQEREVEAGVPGGPLAGSLLVAKGAERGPVVIIVPGSGPTDRNGNSPLGIAAAPYRLLAAGLASAGVASLRIDKRGMFGSAGIFADPNDVTFDDYAADLRAWIDVARAETGAGCAWLAGHSEGGVSALVTAATRPGGLCGVVLVATPGRRLGDVLRDQLRANPANQPLLADALAAIDALERGERVDVSGFHPGLRALFAPAVQGFLIDAFARDPAELVAGFDLPVLVVQGGQDLQVGQADARRLVKARPGVRLAEFPAMNHVLKDVPTGNAAANLAAYADPALPLAAGLAEAIAAFVSETR